LVGLVVVLGPGVVVRADPVLYTDRSAFEASVHNLQTLDFEGLAPTGGFADYSTSTGLTLSGVNFVGTYSGGNLLFVVDPLFSPPDYDWGSGAVLLGPSPMYGDAGIIATLPAGITAVGADLMTDIPYGSSFQITLSTGNTYLVPTDPYPDRAFAGFTSDVPIASLEFTTIDSSWPELDNFTFGTAVPEPASLALFGMGGGILGWCVWCRRRVYRA